MKAVLRMSKRGFEAGMLVVVILALAIAIVTIGAAGRIQETVEEKDYGDTMCRAALANQDMLFNNSMEKSLKVAVSGVTGVASGYYTAKIVGQVTSMVAQMFIGVGEAGAGVKGWQMGGVITKTGWQLPQKKVVS